MIMDTLAVAQITTSTTVSNPIRLIKTIGRLELRQLSPLKVRRGVIRDLYEDDVFAQLEYKPLDRLMTNYT